MVVKIQDIGKARGATKNRKRKGRGIGSGRGKTSGRGHKGAKSRSGGGVYTPGFEGGQMPLVRRVPKRGFTNIFKTKWNVVNIGSLEENKAVKAGMVIDKVFLIDSNMLGKKKLPVKVLGKGKLSKSLTVKADAFSVAAKKAIEEAGGKAELVK
jgi:large subunit ribosomal protein L15